MGRGGPERSTARVRSRWCGARSPAASRWRVTGAFQVSKSNRPGFFFLSSARADAASASTDTTTQTRPAIDTAPSVSGSRARRRLSLGQRAVDAAEADLLAEDREAVEQAGADGGAGDRDAHGVDDVAEAEPLGLHVREGVGLECRG